MNKNDVPLPREQDDHAPAPVHICLLGKFRLLAAGQAVSVRGGGKVEAFLCHLGLRHGRLVSADEIAQKLWPASDASSAHHSLYTVVYNLHKLLEPLVGGASPVLQEDGFYRLNMESGVSVDVICFDAFAHAGDRAVQAGDLLAAAHAYTRAVDLYHGDLCVTSDIFAMIERERLRTRYLSLLSHLATASYNAGNDLECLEYAWQLLSQDPCREDAHRLLMRCYVRIGQRTAALRHFHHCEAVLRRDLDVAPEPATMALFEQIRSNPQTLCSDVE